MKISCAIDKVIFQKIRDIMDLWVQRYDPFCGTSLEYLREYPQTYVNGNRIIQLNDPQIIPKLYITDDYIQIETSSGLGQYEFTPDRFSFEGRRNSWLDGCMLLLPQYFQDIPRIDLEILAPIMPYGCRAYYIGLYNDIKFVSSMPNLPLGISGR